MPWAPDVLPGPIPSDAVFHDAPAAAYASLNDAVENFGHTLFVLPCLAVTHIVLVLDLPMCLLLLVCLPQT